jgi:hypothetical protein
MGHFLAVHHHSSSTRPNVPDQSSDQGCLPHSVSPHQADRFTRADGKTDSVEDVAQTVKRVKIERLENG